jgi:pyruvate kinase
MHKRNRSVKILATLGPASSEVEQIKELHLAGADVFRINMSHGDPEKMRAMMAKIREVEADVGSTIGIWSIFRARNCALACSPMMR